MAVTYGFYNSLNKDRMYNAEQMSAIFDGIITDGVFGAIGDKLMPVAGTGMQVIVKTGKCWFNSTWTLNDAQLPLDVEAADVSLTRIDAVVVEINSAVGTRANSIKVIKGTPSANPAKPTLSATETLHQYALGYITVAAGATAITATNIEVNVGKTTCPFITSVLQQTDITDLFNQWDAEFNAWFSNVQSQLSGDIAANLQRQIDEKVNLSDKATDEDIANGTPDKWVDAEKLDLIEKIGDIKITARTLDETKYLQYKYGTFNPEEYSDLYDLFSANTTKFDRFVARSDADLASTNYRRPYFKIVGDYFVILNYAGRYNPSDPSQSFQLAKKDGDFVKVTYSKYIYDIVYLDDQYLVVARDSSIDLGGNLYFGWTNSPAQEPSAWIQCETLNVAPMTNNSIIKFDGCYVAPYLISWSDGQATTGIAYSSDLKTWEKSIIDTYVKGANCVDRILDANGKLVVFHHSNSASSPSLRATVYDNLQLENPISAGTSVRPFTRYCTGFDTLAMDDDIYILQYTSDSGYTYKCYRWNITSNTITEISIPGDSLSICAMTRFDGELYLLSASCAIYKITNDMGVKVGEVYRTPNSSSIGSCLPLSYAFYFDEFIMYVTSLSGNILYTSMKNIFMGYTVPAPLKAYIRTR